MKENEKEFLAQVAMGWFEVDLEKGIVFRKARSIGGSRIGSKPYMKMTQKKERAEKSISKDHLKIMFTTGIRQRMAVYSHRIIWMMANHADIPEGLEINHKDGNPKNNLPQNLEVVTRQQNSLHAGRILKVMGRKAKREQALAIRELCKSKTMTQKEIANLFGLCVNTVNNIYLRRSWKSLPD